MRYANNKMEDVVIAYIGGGSRGWAWTFMTDLALDDQISGTIRLYDIDHAAAAANETIGNELMQRPDAKGKWKFEVASDIEKALTGCDFVVISILPGTFDEMESDVHLPERLGIYQ
ncbi:MAG: alpha-glucosidase/alpha-galactosidase, partial [Lachnospiraceae bacterium]|nr:alpha-glucosidase/alpha-galactosidase [Lachnospiraceae bacterium]